MLPRFAQSAYRFSPLTILIFTVQRLRRNKEADETSAPLLRSAHCTVKTDCTILSKLLQGFPPLHPPPFKEVDFLVLYVFLPSNFSYFFMLFSFSFFCLSFRGFRVSLTSEKWRQKTLKTAVKRDGTFLLFLPSKKIWRQFFEENAVTFLCLLLHVF